MIELNVRFTSSDRFVIKSNNRETDALEFIAPVNDGDRAEIREYLEKYTSLYMMDVDDRSAERTEAKLPLWGAALFESIFSVGDAKEIFKNFQDSDERDKILTISASHPLILSLPWELLSDPEGTYLSHGENPISIRRSFSQLTNESEFQQDSVKQSIAPPKNRLRLLFVISRPIGAGFLDPRKDALATLEAIAKNAQGLIDVEFLRPATLDKLVERLADKSLPSVDIVHFDGHGVFDANKNIGYLLFEDIGGNGDRVSAARVGESLSQAGISAMLLSACQTAAVAGEEAIGSVAAGLTHAGIPTVLAMQYSVLTSTTEQMFGAFYEHLTGGQRFGEALENARRYLYAHRERGDRQRGRDRVTLRLQDWFLPALYQVGRDRALLEVVDPPQPSLERGEKIGGNISEVQKAGFWGRARELWQIERAYVRDTRRVTISGFGGMGKTYLAEEVGRWLLRTGMFARVCLVGYANFQGIDAVSYAVSVLATVLETNLIDAAAVTRALADQSVLVILDNLESLDAEQLVSLLDAAKEWSEAGESRVLLTTRTPDLHHPDYQVKDPDARREKPWLPHKHVSLQLEGLRPDDAVNYFQRLLKLPPAPRLDLPFRNDLLALFELVQRLPLAIGLLAAQLKDRQVLDVRKELEELLVQSPDNPLLASLNLSINRLDPEAQEWIKNLGVFQGSVFEHNLVAITEVVEKEWNKIRVQLETIGLIQAEPLIRLGVTIPFLKFHPILASTMWGRLTNTEKQELLSNHFQCYYELSDYLYFEDDKNSFVTREIFQLELSNLLFAVRGAIKVGEDFAVDFVDKVNFFLQVFGLNQDREDLTKRLQHIDSEAGSQTWYLTQINLGEQLQNAGRYADAEMVFKKILSELGTTPTYERCTTLNLLGRCYWATGQPERAAENYRLGLEVAAMLEQNNGTKRQISSLQIDFGDVLIAMGNYELVHESYKELLAMKKDLGVDRRGEAVMQIQLGTLALVQKKLPEALQLYQKALAIFQQLKEPLAEAITWHNLGRTFEESRQWAYAEQAYRQSARIKEAQGLIGRSNGAVTTWNHLALVSVGAGKMKEAEEWYRKAIQGFRDSGNGVMACGAIKNLANLLQQFPDRLNEAQQLAEEGLTIDKNLDSVASEIWKTYSILAEISDKQGDTAKARDYRRLSRESHANFVGTKYELSQHTKLIDGTVKAVDDDELRHRLETFLGQMIPHGWQNLVIAIRKILNGQRDEDILCEGLDYQDYEIIIAILHGIESK
ncbi:CHAT domain-containing protein [Pseudanabaena sp. UWO310]|uniref:CHAT domain-containing protein n=1 Tax=Pseudanabaena sp. UWO310 TaxID=2480795 RepID=UPI00115A0BE4|nr:CHAT domain-containing protein [Pseudanabaena sp. UWO310]TYQ30748.1 tetratricopeptide repeat protein [Pseudanabaena sp. UWO310]